jgi:hypothetical protein
MSGLHLQPRRISPEVLEPVNVTLRLVKDVHDHVAIIRHDPLAHRESVNTERRAFVLLLQPGFELVHNRLQLRLRRARTDDEEIGERGELPNIEDDDVLGLLVFDDAGAQPGESV